MKINNPKGLVSKNIMIVSNINIIEHSLVQFSFEILVAKNFESFSVKGKQIKEVIIIIINIRNSKEGVS